MNGIILKNPADCTQKEINRFYELLKLGGQVKTNHLKQKIAKAHLLAFYIEKNKIVAIGGLKNPSTQYKNRIFKEAQTNLEAHAYQYELGWAFTLMEYRGHKLS